MVKLQGFSIILSILDALNPDYLKKHLLIILFFVYSAGVEAQSWVYHSFPTDSAKWRERSGDILCNCCNDYELTLTGDTVISSLVFHKIHHTGVNHSIPNTSYVSGYYWGCWGGSNSLNYLSHNSGSSYIGAYREDVVAKKVYYIEPGQATDTLLYDFNLAVGDTLPPSYINDTAYIMTACLNVVSSIDSVLVGSFYHKRFNISNIMNMPSDSSYVSIIEGVGSTTGLLYQLMGQFERKGELMCFSEQDSVLYPPGAFCAQYNVGFDEIKESQDFILYPNPTPGLFQIKTDQEINSIEVLDIFGRRIYYSEKNQTEINISTFTNGIYFVRLIDSKGNSVVKKIIKN